MLIRQLVDQHIVHERALRRREGRILNLADCEFRRIVRRDVLHSLERIAPRNLDLAHVAHVEQPGTRSHRHVLVDDAGVLNGHVPAAEFDHAGTERSMARIERGLLERAGGRLRHQRWWIRAHKTVLARAAQSAPAKGHNL